eukprot:gene2345-8647_t
MQPIILFLLLHFWIQCSSAFYAFEYEDLELYSHARRMLDTGTFPPPTRSAYASEGQVKSFIGDVQTNEQLLDALQHCSYKKEIIILSSMHHPNSIDAAAQTMWMLGRFGIAHVMLIIGSAEACASNAENLPRALQHRSCDADNRVCRSMRFGIAHVMLITGSAEACASNAENLPGVCCVWAAPELPSGNEVAANAFGGTRRQNHFRLCINSCILRHGFKLMSLDSDIMIMDDPYKLRINSRILRMGYNLMSLDTDIVIMDDPYKYFKGPLFADKHFMACGHAMEVNIGIMYIQNIAPDGPVAWVFAETVDRQLRWAENPDFIQAKVYPKLYNFQVSLSFNHTWMHMHQTLVKPYVKEKEVTLTEDLKKHFRSDKVKLLQFDIVRPFTNGVWPFYLGGEGYPAERRNFSLAFQKELAIPGVPMWPEPHQKQPDGCTARTAVTPSRRRRLHARGALPSDVSSRDWLPHLERSTPKQEELYQQVLKEHRLLIATGALEGYEKDHLIAIGALEGDEMDHLTSTRALEGDKRDVGIGGAKRRVQEEALVVEKEQVVGTVNVGQGGLCGPVETVAPLPNPVSAMWYGRDLRRGEWDYRNTEINTKAKKGLIYLASTPETPVPKLLSPTKELRAALGHMNIIQLLETLRALYIAAHAAGRSIAWPALDCEKLRSVIHQIKAHPELKRGKDAWYSTGTVPYTIDEQPGMCIWLDFMWQSCLEGGRGLLPYETKHFLDVLPAEQAAESKKTILPRPSGAAPQATQAQALLRKILSDSDKVVHSMSAGEMGKLVLTTDLATWREATVNDTNIEALPMLYVSHVPNITDFSSDILGKVMAALGNCRGLTLF